MNRGAWWATVKGHKDPDMTEQLRNLYTSKNKLTEENEQDIK